MEQAHFIARTGNVTIRDTEKNFNPNDHQQKVMHNDIWHFWKFNSGYSIKKVVRNNKKKTTNNFIMVLDGRVVYYF